MAFYYFTNDFVKCPSCGRLWVFWDKKSNMPTEYIPSDVQSESAVQRGEQLLRCSCKADISFGGAASSTEWRFAADAEFFVDDYPDETTIDQEKMYNLMRTFVKCQKCGNLWVFWDGPELPPREYIFHRCKE